MILTKPESEQHSVITESSQHDRFRYSCDMDFRGKYRDVVRQLAFDNYGYVTTKQATDAGVPAVELPKLAARGGLENIAYGLYRVPDVPPTDYDQFAEALLRVGEGAYLHGESVLALLKLGDVNPRRIHVAINRRARPQLPPFVAPSHRKTEPPTTLYQGLKSQLVADAIVECVPTIEKTRLQEAAKQARSEGLLSTTEWQQVRKSLRT